jgi:hypothetical protein
MPDSPAHLRAAGNDDSGFERRLNKIVQTSTTEAEEQSGLMLELVREAHAIKWILIWMLILVPIIALVLGIIGDVALSKSVPTLRLTGGY